MSSATEKIITLPAIPIRDMVFFPGVRVPFVVGRSCSVRTLELALRAGDHLLLLTQKDPQLEQPKTEDLYPIGTLALVESLITLPNRYYKVTVKGVGRVQLLNYMDQAEVIRAEVRLLQESELRPEPNRETFHKAVETFLARNPDPARMLSMEQVRELPLGRAIDQVAAMVPMEVRHKQAVLEPIEIVPRLEALLKLLEMESTRTEVDRTVEERARQRMDEDHRQYVLNEKMRALQQEMGKKEDEFQKLRIRIQEAGMSEEAQKKALEELDRLEVMPPQSAESTVSRTYIDWLLALPWHAMAEDKLDLIWAKEILDEDHSGLEKVKTRIVEYLAVLRKLRDREAQAEAEQQAAADAVEAGEPRPLREPKPLKGPILCLVGPPGVGKTSLAKSIARALNRPFVRFSLGGVHDEAEIRGHRRTYIGSMPGRIISLIKKAGVRNPVMLLDEIDKMGKDWRGDPSAALLEVLDPEQNHAFQDHYLDVGFDLGQILFLATANVRHEIPDPLEDRLEILELPGYTLREKVAIAEQHLLPKSLESHGMTGMDIHFQVGALEKLIQAYTREAGVRQLEREISNILRKLARQSLETPETFDPDLSDERLIKLLGAEKFLDPRLDEDYAPGTVNGLAWTPTGGDLLVIEVLVLPGKGNLRLTGKLGEVMQESGQIALSYVRSRAQRLGLDPDRFEKIDIHVHIPEGAIPKDGPSAGITLATAILSALTGIPARCDTAMTGELTLRGNVLPIGGLKEKLLAAHRMRRKAVIIPTENARHLEDIPQEIREQLSIHMVGHMDEVVPLILSRLPEINTQGFSTSQDRPAQVEV